MKISFTVLLLFVPSVFIASFIDNQIAKGVHAQFERPTNSTPSLFVLAEYRRDTSNELRSITSHSDSDNEILQREQPLALAPSDESDPTQRPTPTPTPHMTPVTPESAAVEQRSQGSKNRSDGR
jgi:hypothetical protein